MLKCFLLLALIEQCFGISGVSFFLHRRGNSERLSNEIVPANFDRNKNTYVLLHGMGGNSEDGCMKNLKNAILQREDANVIVPDYSVSALYYTMFYQDIGRDICNFLKRNLMNIQRTTVMGQSLGGQIAGILGSHGCKPDSVIGLDPAGPRFAAMPEFRKLSPLSAKKVQVVHTNTGQLGSSTIDGHLDVYINRGTDFPCCSSTVCRHTGACDWMASTIRRGPVQGNSCVSQANARSGSCSRNSVTVGFGAPINPQGRTIAHLSLTECVPKN